MNTSNAFMFVGVGMMAEWCALAAEFSAARELWLAVMGGVFLLAGGGFLASEAWAWTKPRMITPLAAWRPRPAGSPARELPQTGRAVV